MQNFQLLREAGRSGLPVLLKRGMAATIDEWLNAAEYIMAEGNPNVVLCERGIRTYETSTRNTLDHERGSGDPFQIPSADYRRSQPRHRRPRLCCTRWQRRGGCGADGLMIEVHNDPGLRSPTARSL